MNDVMVVCPHCQTKNRVPQEKIGQPAKCGKCGGEFIAAQQHATEPLPVTDATFAAEVLQAQLPVLVDIWAPWCGPCRMIAPVIAEIAQEFAGRLKVVKVNSDDNPATSAQYDVQGIPTLLVFRGGKVVERIVGAAPKPQIVSKLRQYV